MLAAGEQGSSSPMIAVFDPTSVHAPPLGRCSGGMAPVCPTTNTVLEVLCPSALKELRNVPQDIASWTQEHGSVVAQ